MRAKSFVVALGLLVTTIVSIGPAQAAPTKFERYVERADKSFAKADFKGAESSWKRALSETEYSQEADKNKNAELCLKRLGECCLKSEKYLEAADYYKRAQEVCKTDNIDDAELQKDVLDLQSSFKEVPVPEFADFLSSAFKELAPDTEPEKVPNFLTALQEAGVEHVSMIHTPDGTTNVVVGLGNRFIKEVGNKDVSHIALDKAITFKITQTESGGVSIANIRGLHVKAKIWVNIIASDIFQDPDKGPLALVTGEKFGVSQKVSCKLPQNALSPFVAFVRKMTTFGPAIIENVTGSTVAGATGGTGSTGSSGGTGVENATTGGPIVPVSNPPVSPDGTTSTPVIPENGTASPVAD